MPQSKRRKAQIQPAHAAKKPRPTARRSCLRPSKRQVSQAATAFIPFRAMVLGTALGNNLFPA